MLSQAQVMSLFKCLKFKYLKELLSKSFNALKAVQIYVLNIKVESKKKSYFFSAFTKLSNSSLVTFFELPLDS